MCNDAAIGWINPLAVVGDAGTGADGADDGAAGDFDFVGALDDVVEGHGEVLAAKYEEAGGMGMAIDGGAVADAVAFGDQGRAAPVNEIEVDELALRVLADFAETLVTVEVHQFGKLYAAEAAVRSGF